MHTRYYAIVCLVAATALSGCGDDGIEYIGILQNRPVGTAGVWVVDGNPYTANYKTELNDDYGPLGIGACVDIVMKRGVVRKIESKNPDECARRESRKN